MCKHETANQSLPISTEYRKFLRYLYLLLKLWNFIKNWLYYVYLYFFYSLTLSITQHGRHRKPTVKTFPIFSRILEALLEWRNSTPRFASTPNGNINLNKYLISSRFFYFYWFMAFQLECAIWSLITSPISSVFIGEHTKEYVQ